MERWIIVGEKEVDLDDGTRVRLERCPTPLSLRSLPDRNLFASKSARVACQRSASTGVCRGTRAPEGQVFAAHVYRMRDDDTSMNHTPSFVRFTPAPSSPGISSFSGEKKNSGKCVSSQFDSSLFSVSNRCKSIYPLTG